MKFKTEKDVIFDELNILQDIVEKRNTMPILSNILLLTRNGSIEMIATDLEVGLITKFNADVEKEGSVALPGKKFFEIIKSLPEGEEIYIKEMENNKIEIKSAMTRFVMLSSIAEDFPKISLPDKKEKIEIPFKPFIEMVNKTLYVLASEQRYTLNGALFILKENSMELVATDGHRLSYNKSKVETKMEGNEQRIIISKKTLQEIKRMDGIDKFNFYLNENNLFFEMDNRILISRKMDFSFPPYEKVIPFDNENRATINREDFINAIKRVFIFSSERSRGIKFTFEGDKVFLFTSNPELGEASDSVDIGYVGNELEISFNAHYILDFLNSLDDEKIIVEMRDSEKAVLFKPEETNNYTYLYVLMPMKI
ncbi:MAG: DNA polymerase III subunit beta [Acidobacteriota bacterium]